MPPPRRHIDARRRVEEAMAFNRLRLHYQPIVELAAGSAVGFEALIRLERGGEAPVSPREFIMAAEDTGLITTIGDWVLGQALVDAVKLNPPEARNAALRKCECLGQAASSTQLRHVVRAHMMATGADPSLLVLEITENLFVGGCDRAWAFLAGLRRDGTRVAIDDYGTGYASLSYLRQPGIDIIKD